MNKPQMMIVCSCKRSFPFSTYQTHIATSRLCAYTKELREQEAKMTGLVLNPLEQCICGYICARKSMGLHEMGVKHTLLMDAMVKGPLCESCQLHYRGSQKAHNSSIDHKLNMMKLIDYKKQCKLAAIDVLKTERQLVKEFNGKIKEAVSMYEVEARREARHEIEEIKKKEEESKTQVVRHELRILAANRKLREERILRLKLNDEKKEAQLRITQETYAQRVNGVGQVRGARIDQQQQISQRFVDPRMLQNSIIEVESENQMIQQEGDDGDFLDLGNFQFGEQPPNIPPDFPEQLLHERPQILGFKVDQHGVPITDTPAEQEAAQLMFDARLIKEGGLPLGPRWHFQYSCDPKNQCYICALKDNLPMLRTFCDHTFHPSCVAPWLNEHTKCPTCKKDIKLDFMLNYERIIQKRLKDIAAQKQNGQPVEQNGQPMEVVQVQQQPQQVQNIQYSPLEVEGPRKRQNSTRQKEMTSARQLDFSQTNTNLNQMGTLTRSRVQKRVLSSPEEDLSRYQRQLEEKLNEEQELINSHYNNY